MYEAVVAYQKYSSSEPFVNLLPGEEENYYTSNAANQKYKNYIDYYFTNIAPLLGYVSFDQYPLKTDSVSTTHLANLALLANNCKNGGYDLRTFVYSSIDGSSEQRAIKTEQDLSFQVYSNLAFGATDITYFTYGGLVDRNTLQPTSLAACAEKVNNGVLAFGKEYRKYKWQGVKTVDVGATNKGFTILHNVVSDVSVDGLSITATQDALAGVFKDDDGNDAYIVMNYNDPSDLSTVGTVTMTFEGVSQVIVYSNGNKTVRDLTDGKLELDLKAGEGTFIIPVRGK